jgi:hypothetical protein
MLWIFSPEKSDGFGRVRTRDLGYQRPACLGFCVYRCGNLQRGFITWSDCSCYWLSDVSSWRIVVEAWLETEFIDLREDL